MKAPSSRRTAPERAVCLDGRSLHLQEGTGVWTYARSLAAELPAAGWRADVLLEGRRDESLVRRRLRAAWPLASRAAPAPPPPGFARAWSSADVFRRAQVFFDVHRRLLPVTAAEPPALMHWLAPAPLRFAGAINVCTIYDLIPLLHPELTSTDPERFGRMLRQLVRAADHVVTISQSVRRDIVRRLGVAEERVTNAYVPVDVAGAAPRSPVRGHFLACGSIEPRKNIARLLAAHRASGVATPLVLAGPDGWRAAEELAASGMEVRPLAEMPAEARGGVWRAPWLPRPELLALMRDAKALLFPSLAEGFGMPLAEAMALGVPALTSRGGATEEVAGGAALLVDPTDTAQLASAIAALDTDADLRARLAAAGRVRAAAFTSPAFTARLETAYAKALAV